MRCVWLACVCWAVAGYRHTLSFYACEEVQYPTEKAVIQSQFVYLLAATNDSALNPRSGHYFHRYNIREKWIDSGKGGFEVYWQDLPGGPWRILDLHTNNTDEEATTYWRQELGPCKERDWCRMAMWHSELWKGHRFYLNFLCVTDIMGHELFYEGGPSDPELVSYAWSLIQAKGGGLEKFNLVQVPTGPSEQPCPWGKEDS
ncbi:unnamed protein product [Effrenium voratum]|uniref:Uncharacterized protein n=1 Tax=Effrenium voratum TaxID=2562239 RepID=A0AA36J948_9DINO|nr:unnamed protein product [Effrenium voratum]